MNTFSEFVRSHVLGLVAIFIAITGTAVAAQDGTTASSSAVSNAKFKKLKQRVAKLEGRSTAPSGPAGGDLAGTYPNPLIGTNKVTTTKIADNAVTTEKVADGTLTLGDMGASTHLLCSGSAQYLQGACIDVAARPQQNYLDALNDCRIVSGRLPTLAELDAFRIRAGITIGTEYTYNFTGAAPNGGSAYLMDDNGAITAEANEATAHPYHCVRDVSG